MANEQVPPETRPTLLRRVCALDPKSWEEFVTLYQRLLLAYVAAIDSRYQLGFHANDHEDIKQEVLIKLYHEMPRFKLNGRFRTWLWTLTRNVVIDWTRRERGRGKSRRAKVNLTADLDELPAADNCPPDEQVIEAHVWQVRRQILEKVQAELESSAKWVCFQRCFLGGEPAADVARDLSVTVNAVNQNTFRVRARIRELCDYYDVEL
jgi:RNA polymerase sigma-70 factor, ECF subfamily